MHMASTDYTPNPSMVDKQNNLKVFKQMSLMEVNVTTAHFIFPWKWFNSSYFSSSGILASRWSNVNLRVVLQLLKTDAKENQSKRNQSLKIRV